MVQKAVRANIGLRKQVIDRDTIVRSVVTPFTFGFAHQMPADIAVRDLIYLADLLAAMADYLVVSKFECVSHVHSSAILHTGLPFARSMQTAKSDKVISLFV
jgi:hypothetical protein